MIVELILWDEPTNHLDIETIKLFEEELLQSENAYILITHDRFLLSNTTKRIVHIQRGELKTFEGTYALYLEYLSQQETIRKQQLARLQNTLKRETAWMRQGVKARATRSKKRVESFNDLLQNVRSIKSEAKKELELSLSHSQRKTKQLVGVQDATFGFGDRVLFDNINVNICKGEKIGLLGGNGAGKSTLMKIFKGDYKLDSGIMKSAEDLDILYFGQKREELEENMTPFELLGDGQDMINLPGDKVMHVAAYFESYLFDRNELHRPIKTFSGGEKK